MYFTPLLFKCHHRFLWQLFILAVQKMDYHFICKAVCFHGIPIGKSVVLIGLFASEIYKSSIFMDLLVNP